MSIQKTLTETYSLKGKKCLWAKINLDCGKESVNVMISSDYGEFNHFWGACGKNPKKFLTGLDWHYTMKKLMGGSDNLVEPDFAERLKSYKKAIIEERREDNISKSEAREYWKEMGDIFDYCQNSNDIYFSKVFESKGYKKVFYDFESIPNDTRIKAIVKDFWDDIWTPFTEFLGTEIREEENKKAS